MKLKIFHLVWVSPVVAASKRSVPPVSNRSSPQMATVLVGGPQHRSDDNNSHINNDSDKESHNDNNDNNHNNIYNNNHNDNDNANNKSLTKTIPTTTPTSQRQHGNKNTQTEILGNTGEPKIIPQKYSTTKLRRCIRTPTSFVFYRQFRISIFITMHHIDVNNSLSVGVYTHIYMYIYTSLYQVYIYNVYIVDTNRPNKHNANTPAITNTIMVYSFFRYTLRSLGPTKFG